MTSARADAPALVLWFPEHAPLDVSAALIYCVLMHTMEKPWSTQAKLEDVFQDSPNALHLLMAFQSTGAEQS